MAKKPDRPSITPAQSTDPRQADAWRGEALRFLQNQLRDRAPTVLDGPWMFDVSPLEGEGPTVLFQFRTALADRPAEPHWVAVGRTEPNYYPGAGLDVETAYALHLGTRFMLTMGIGAARSERLATLDPIAAVRLHLDRIAPGTPIEDVRVAAAFELDDQLHAVIACRIGGQAAYVFAADAPPGFSTQVALAPHLAYRIHLGRVLLSEPAPDEEDEHTAPHGQP